MAPQRQLQLAVKLGDALEQGLLEEVETPGHFLLDFWPLQANLAGQPEQVDLVAQVLDQGLAFSRRPAVGLELHQQAVDAAVDFQHRDPLRFGGMGGDDRADAGLGQDLTDRPGFDAGGRGPRQHPVEAAHHLVGAGQHLDPPSLTRKGVFLGDVQKLQPDALSLQAAQEQLAVRVQGFEPGREDRLDLRLARAQHVEQQSEELLNRAFEIGIFLRPGQLEPVGRRQPGTRRRHATRSGGGSPAKKARTFRATRIPMATRVSSVALPRCGSRTTFSRLARSGETLGSFS